MYSEDGTVTRMAGTAVQHSQVLLAGTRAEQSEPGTASPQLHSACLLHSTYKNKRIDETCWSKTPGLFSSRPPARCSLCTAP